MSRLRPVLAVLLLVTGQCGSLGPSTPADPGNDPANPFHVLFIGNSLTYINDLPSMVRALADSAGAEKMYVEQVAKPDYALEDHWADGDARRAINRGGWRIVVLQQGPSSLPENRANLRQLAATFAQVIRQAGGTPALYQVWPANANFGTFDAALESYRLAAEDVQGPLLPGGAAWRAAWRRDPALPLYAADGLHASVQGSYLVALTIFGALQHRSVIGLPAGLTVPFGSFRLTDIQARTLQEAADEVNAAVIAH